MMAGESQQTPKSEPDPTVMVTEQLDRAIEANEKLWQAALKGETDLTAERISGIRDQIKTFETLRVEQKADTKQGVDDALAAVKEANEKTERWVASQISALQEGQKASDQSWRRELDSVRERVGRIENVKVGGQQAYAGLYALIAAVGVVLGILVVIANQVGK